MSVNPSTYLSGIESAHDGMMWTANELCKKANLLREEAHAHLGIFPRSDGRWCIMGLPDCDFASPRMAAMFLGGELVLNQALYEGRLDRWPASLSKHSQRKRGSNDNQGS